VYVVILKPIPKHLAQQQLANFIQGTNRGDMWKHMGGNKGMALSEYTGKSPGFVPAGQSLEINPYILIVPYLYFLPDSAIPLFPPICFHISPLFVP
jgi:hypothetical protein